MRKMKHILFLVLAAIALTACTQDELAEQPTALPEGAYPITIASVQVAEALPQTRVTETSDGMGSTWNERNPDMVIVKVTGGGNDAESTYTLFGNQIIASTANLWWHTTETSSVNAWYSNLKGSNTSSDMFAVTLADQTTDNGLAYVLKADEVEANYQTENITLTFRHQLAKIRVKLEGAKAGDVTSVSVKSRTSCTVAEGNVTAGTDEGYIAMRQATYNGQVYWEANVVPGVEIKDFRLNGDVDCQLTQTVTPQAGHVHEVNINVKPKFSIVDNDGNPVDAGNINTDVTITGASDQPITITGTCNVTLKDVSLNIVERNNGISVTSGSPTIIVNGTGNTITTGIFAAGIHVAPGASVTIKGNSESDILRITSREGAAIGGYYRNQTSISCGDITIEDVTLYAYTTPNPSYVCAPGIGGLGITCGSITITNATVYAQGASDDGSRGDCGPAIGCGMNDYSETCVPKIIISGSEIHAYRGTYSNYWTGVEQSYANYIGQGGSENYGAAEGDIQTGDGGSIKSSTVYKYTLNIDATSYTEDGVLEYDENGEIVE